MDVAGLPGVSIKSKSFINVVTLRVRGSSGGFSQLDADAFAEALRGTNLAIKQVLFASPDRFDVQLSAEGRDANMTDGQVCDRLERELATYLSGLEVQDAKSG
jgi:hypothetical protein